MRFRRAIAALVASTALAIAAPGGGSPLGPTGDGRAEATTAEVIIVGDSIVSISQWRIRPELQRRGIDIDIDAAKRRSIVRDTTFAGQLVRSGAATVRSMVAAGRRPDLWVIELGTNDLGPMFGCGCDDLVAFAGEMIDDLLAELPAGADVIWVTVYDRGAATVTEAFNTALHVRGLPIIDWWSAALGHDEWLDDRVHPSSVGVGALTGVLADGIEAQLAWLDRRDEPRSGLERATRGVVVSYPT